MNTGESRFSPHYLRGLRSRDGFTVQDVADYLGVSRQTVWSIESGRTLPTANQLPQLAALFNVEIQTFFTQPDETSSEEGGTSGSEKDPEVDTRAPRPDMAEQACRGDQGN